MKRPMAIVVSTIGALVVFAVLVLTLGGFIPTITELRMDKLSIGMTEDETLRILGQPATIVTNGDVVFWHYDTWRKYAEPYIVFNNDQRIKAFGSED